LIPTEPVVEEKDPDEVELEKLEKGDPEMVKICNLTLTQLEEFKVLKTFKKFYDLKEISLNNFHYSIQIQFILILL